MCRSERHEEHEPEEHAEGDHEVVALEDELDRRTVGRGDGVEAR